ncbi:MAG: putative lipid II flippase FtsW [Armatimonadetes bacterium]|nr:putative lipid II flippase FtsW [Armatimonadota bacterium]
MSRTHPKRTQTNGRKAEDGPTPQPMDRLLFLLMLMLIGVGIVTVYDASYALALEKGDSFHFVKRQALCAVIGLGALLITRRVPYWKWRGWAAVGLALSVILLVAVFVPHVGSKINGARRWIGHGQFQPSELAKLMLVLYLARVLSTKPKKILSFGDGLLPPLIVIGVLAALIAKEPDMGTALVLGGTGLILLFLAGARPRHMAGIFGLVAGVVALMVVLMPYRMHRVLAFLNPKADQLQAGYQVWHALIALGSGGVTGLGLGEGREKLYIPMASSDFIFPVIGEEWGLIGTLILVIVFTLIALRGFTIAYRTRDPFGALLAAGITTLISLQALVNMAVATSSIPDTGVPLPFISSGGSALVLMMAGVGLLLNISTYPDGPGAAGGYQDEQPDPYEEDWNRRWERGPAANRLSSVPARRRDIPPRRRAGGDWE